MTAGTIGHPLLCLGPFTYFTIRGTVDIFVDKSCTSDSTLTSSELTFIQRGLVSYCILSLLIVIPAVIRVTNNLHKDVKQELEWKEMDAHDRGVAIEHAIEGQDSQFVFGHNGPEPSVPIRNEMNGNNHAPSAPSLVEVNNIANNPPHVANDAGDIPMTASERAFNMDVFNAANQNDPSPPPQLRQNTEEQLRIVMAASILTAQQEEEKRMHNVTTESQQQTDLKGLNPGISEASVIRKRSGSVSMTGFWAKGKGLSSAALATMFSQSENECIVCYEDYEIGQILAKLKCGHQLHKQCAIEWLSENPTCPVCRMNVMRT